MTSDRVTVEYRIRLSVPRPDPRRYAGFWDFPTAMISDAYFKRQTLPHHIKPVYAGCPKVVGPAITCQVTPGDELIPLKAIEICQPGDVIVVVGAFTPRFCVWGGIMSTMAKVRGCAGLITDGLVRDVAECREAEFPIYAAGVTPMAPCMNVPPGELNYPIVFGTAEIAPGDIIVADEDGIVAVPQNMIEQVAAAVEARKQKEKAWLDQIYATRSMILKDTVDKLLAGRSTIVEGG